MSRYTVGLYTFTFLDIVEIRCAEAEARYLRKLRSEIGFVPSTYFTKVDDMFEAQKGEHEGR